MHILVVSDTHGLIDGVSMNLADEQRYFEAAGHHVTIVSTQTPYTRDFYVSRFRPYYRTFDAVPARLRRHLRRRVQQTGRRFTVLYSQAVTPQGLMFSLYLSAIFAVPILTRFHTYLPDYYEFTYPRGAGPGTRAFIKGLLIVYLRLIMRRSRRVIVSVRNERLQRYLSKVLLVPETVVNHIPVYRIGPPAGERERRRTAEAAPLLLTVTRISREKNLPFLVQVWNEELCTRLPTARWRIVGPGPMIEEIRAMLRSAERVDVVGPLPREAVIDEMRRADVFLYSSLSETFGMIIAEAKACALPIVALADRAGVQAQLDSGRSGGFVVPDAAAFAAAVELLVNDKELAERLGATGLADIVARFGDSCLDRLSDLLSGAAADRVSAGHRAVCYLLARAVRFSLWTLPRAFGGVVELAADPA